MNIVIVLTVDSKCQKQAFFLFIDNNLCISVWISMKLYHNFPTKKEKIGTDCLCFDPNCFGLTKTNIKFLYK